MVADTLLYFRAEDSMHNKEIWISDGKQTGTHLLKDIAPGNYSGFRAMVGPVNGKLVFYGYDTLHGTEPWITDGTTAGTQLLKDFYPGAVPFNNLYSSDVSYFSTGTKLYFAINDSTHGSELWVTDGTIAGTQLVKDINPGYGGSNVTVYNIQYNGKIFFTANDGIHGEELWSTDGTNGGTNIVVDLSTGTSNSSIGNLTIYNNKLYFSAMKNNSFSLMESDGTANGTKLVKYVAINEITPFNGKMYFSGTVPYSKNSEPWISDGTSTGTHMFMDINPASGQPSIPHTFIVLGNHLFFTINQSANANGTKLYVTDGSSQGTRILQDNNGNDIAYAHSPMVYKNKLYFGMTGSNGGRDLWETDGTNGGTKMIKKADSNFSFHGNFAVCNNSLYFGGRESTHSAGYELWKLTDTSTTPPANIITTKEILSTIKIAPNPAHDRVRIQTAWSMENGRIILTDIAGKVILRHTVKEHTKNIVLKLPDVPAGIYNISVEMEGALYNEKLLIE